MRKGELLQRAKLKLVGHLNYYAITDNWQMCNNFRTRFMQLMYKWLNRQSRSGATIGSSLKMLSPGRVAICENQAQLRSVSPRVDPEGKLKSRMLGKPLVRFCEGRGGNWTIRC